MLRKYLINSKSYWESKLIFIKINFHFHAWLANLRLWKSEKQNFSVFWQFFKQLFIRLVFAVGSIIFLETLENKYYIKNYILSVSNKVGVKLFDLKDNQLVYLINNDIYSDLLTVFSALAGIYFATVSIIITTSYTKLSRQTIDFIWRTPPYKFFFDYVITLIAFCLFLTALNNLNYKTGILIYILINSLAILCIPIFAIVSVKLFYLISPLTILHDKIINDILSWIKKATTNGQQWYKPEVQDFYRRKVEVGLEAAENIIESLVEQDTLGKKRLIHLSSADFSNLSNSIFILLYYYSILKLQIPKNSRWFKLKVKHKKWFGINSYELELALNAGISLRHEEVADYLWFEKKVSILFNKVIEYTIRQSDYELSATLLYAIQKYLESIVALGSPDVGLYIISKINDSYREALNKLSLNPLNTSESYIEQSIVPSLMMSDVYGMGIISLILGYIQRVNKYNKPNLEKIFKNINWLSLKELYKHNFPDEVVNELLYIHDKVTFEYKVEGKVISADWYLIQLTVTSILKFLDSIPNEITELLKTNYVNFSKELIKSNNLFLTLQIVDRGLEACSKAEILGNSLLQVHKELMLYIRASDIPHPKIDFQIFIENIEKIRDELIEIFTTTAPLTKTIVKTDLIPDYFGRAYWFISQECFNAIIYNKSNIYTKLFPAFFDLFQTAYMQFVEEYIKSQNNYWITQNKDILNDVLSLSGYALIYGELGNKDIWETTKLQWMNHISKVKDKDIWLKALINLSTGQDGFLEMGGTKRRHIQHNWETNATNDLQKRGIIQAEDFYYRKQDNKRTHESNIIEALSNSVSRLSWFSKPEDIFITCFLEELIDNKNDLDIGQRAKSFKIKMKELSNDKD